jgi:ankyrin repeat protein
MVSCCSAEFLPIVKMLLNHSKIKVNQQNRMGMTALHRACSCGEMVLVKELLSHPNIDTTIKDKVKYYV